MFQNLESPSKNLQFPVRCNFLRTPTFAKSIVHFGTIQIVKSL
ncbi:hypothetical protein LEP1GSC021_3470 [Leptospira noguchii str. 1993005606]|uniref:Uncharacterized protein n=1 Tax=Leptospira noguchii str. 2007001578 TaxID=1049974 RepID=A0ABP2TCS6_9LEPT|nr:hypothetical protein LEP1GSC041_1395 [Leptospira noguchii str. 2006001870]EMI62612.1 hypothetical protein LEP1GSC072_0196 [Leptospira noguchii str. Bonito]EMN01918.1 hypothetical protein LEP1GSC035_4273 [Leptospira noguchii str. 2007001578]EMO29319.1 hypothetical protein LEP1GSC170_1857 [Leptospira interrogans serovar Bataviae str. HAI135]EMS82719.1 hypothetical protein LEP1GSC073_2698 [Leptospira noguchii str. Cascata]EPE84760.1 hypothetical protein LEP1GSC021_3470 [Leptospira noguchii str